MLPTPRLRSPSGSSHSPFVWRSNALEQPTNHHGRGKSAGDTDRQWQLGPEGARRVLARTSQTGTTQPLSQLSAGLADRVLSRARAARPSPRVEDLPKVMVDPSLAADLDPMVAVAPPAPQKIEPRRPRGWMFAPENGGRPSIVDDDELRAATARPFAGLFLWMRRLFS